MENKEIVNKLRIVVQYLSETRIPVGEKEIIERLMTAASLLEKMASDIEKELEADALNAATEDKKGE